MKKIISQLLAVIGAFFLLVALTPVTAWLAMPLIRWGNSRGDILIVLAGDGENIGVIGYTSYWRAVYALEAFRAAHFKSVVVSGGSGTAESIARFLIANGVPPTSIMVEARSQSTRENALNVKPILATMRGKPVLLTSDYHTYRAAQAFRSSGIPVEPLAAPDALKRSNSWHLRANVLYDLILEYVKVGWYKAHGWI